MGDTQITMHNFEIPKNGPHVGCDLGRGDIDGRQKSISKGVKGIITCNSKITRRRK